MRVLLFALTGFGNKVLDALLEKSCEVKYIVTRQEKGPFPYYEEENLGVYARKKNITIYENFTWDEIEKVIKDFSPDLLLVSTFHRIIPDNILSAIPLCINIHPSLLPKYKGPTPIDWVLFDKEKETGATAHFITKDVDCGDMLIQKRVPIEKNDDKSTLIKKLAILSANIAKELIDQINTNSLNPTKQNMNEATYYPNFSKRNN